MSSCCEIRNVLNDVNTRGRHVAVLCFAKWISSNQSYWSSPKYTSAVHFPQRSTHCPCAGQFCVCIKQRRCDVNVSNACVKVINPELTMLWKLRGHGCARDGAKGGKSSMPGLQSHSTWNYQLKMTELRCKSECPFTGQISHLRNHVCV